MEKSLLDATQITEEWLASKFEKLESGSFHFGCVEYELWVKRNSNAEILAEWEVNFYDYSRPKTLHYIERLNTIGQLRSLIWPAIDRLLKAQLPF